MNLKKVALSILLATTPVITLNLAQNPIEASAKSFTKSQINALKDGRLPKMANTPSSPLKVGQKYKDAIKKDPSVLSINDIFFNWTDQYNKKNKGKIISIGTYYEGNYKYKDFKKAFGKPLFQAKIPSTHIDMPNAQTYVFKSGKYYTFMFQYKSSFSNYSNQFIEIGSKNGVNQTLKIHGIDKRIK